MRRFLTSLAAISLVGSFFFTTPAPVAAVDTTIDTVTISSSDGDIIQVADALATTGRYQTYLVDDGTTITTRIYLSGPDTDDGIFTTFSLSLDGSGASFGGEFADTLDMTDFGMCNLDWTDVGPNDQTSTFREGTIDCDGGSSQDEVYIDFPITVPNDGPAVLTVDSAAQDFKVYFFSDEPTGDTIYVGPNAMTTDGDGSCSDPDFSTNGAGVQSFEDQEAIDSALMSINSNSDTVVLCNATYEYESDIRYYDGDDLFTGILTIEAQTDGSVTLDGNNDYNLIQAEDVSFDITGVKFVDGFDGFSGGAIDLYRGNLTVDESEFNSNYSEDYGGAIYAEEGNASISDTTFTDNWADDDDGGSIWHEDGNITLTRTTFTDSWAEDDGGAVWHNNGDLTCTESSFESNYLRDEDGGAIWHRDGSLTINECDFTENSSDEEGGAIWAWPEGSAVVIDDSIFEGNVAEFDDGGAIFIQGDTSSTYITDSDFTGNRADGDGGAVWLRDDATIGFSVFTDNEGYDGGAVYFDHDDDDFHVYNSTFTRNGASSDGGAIGADGDILIEDSRFVGNIAGEDVGGAVEAEARATITGSMFLRNRAGDEGGGVYVEDEAIVSETRFVRNWSTSWGGGLSVADTATVDNTVFRANHSRKGGAIDSWGDRLYLSYVKFINNYARVYGGAVARQASGVQTTEVGDVDRTTLFRANRSRVGGPVAIYRGVDRLAARQSASIWKDAGASVYIVRDARDLNFGGPF